MPSKQRTQQLVVPKPVARASAPAQPKMTPLILVPPSMSTLLNMHNIKRFLEEGVFVPPEEAGAANPKKEVYLRVLRREGRDPKRPVKYHVTDRDPTRKEDWDRLVSVGVLGKTWQFKRWPHKGASSGDMVDTFLKVAGVYFHYADEPIDPLIKQWNVKLIPISRHSRAKDEAAQRAFWEYLDGFVASRPGLRSRVLT
jgi:parafibromin